MELNKQIIIEWLLGNALPLGLIVIFTYILVKITCFLVEKYFNKMIESQNDTELTKRATTLKEIIKSILHIIIILTGSTIFLAKIGIDIGPIIAAAGILGIAIGFGAQRLVEDVIMGFIILMEDQIRVGDVVQIADKAGFVEKVDLKMVVLRDFAANVHYIRNGKIQVITNMTKDYSRYVFDIGVAYRENVDEVMDVIRQIGEELRNDENFKNDILEPIEILGVDKFADSAVMVRARIKTKPIRQWAVGREFNYRLKKKFDELNIEIPFPHRTLYIGKDKQGRSPVLNINADKQGV